MGFELVSSEHLFFIYWFQGRNLLVDDQNFKRGGDVKKREDQRRFFGVFFSIKTFFFTFCFCYSCFSRYYTEREMQRIKVMTALSF